MGQAEIVVVTVDSQYYRKQFEDWLAGGTVEYRAKTYYWAAEDVRYGWQVEPVDEEHWGDIEEAERHQIAAVIMECLCKHESRYFGQVEIA